jgi:cell division protease FtsH
MSNEDNNNKSDKPKESGVPKLPKMPKVKFNFYWIYGVLGVILFALYFNNMGAAPKEVGWGELKGMLENQEIEKILLVNKEQAEIFIKKDKLALPKFKDVKPVNSLAAPAPHYVYQIGSVETFEKDVREAQVNITPPIYVKNETRMNWGGDILSWILPIVVLVGYGLFTD